MCSLYHTAIVKTTMAQWNNRIHIKVQQLQHFLRKWKVQGLPNHRNWCQHPQNSQKDTKIIQIGQMKSLPFLYRMAAILKKGAILNFQMATEASEMITVGLKTYKKDTKIIQIIV